MDARLDTGGWLALTRQGLAPCKRRQAFLGAITLGVRRGWKPSPARPGWARELAPGRAVTPRQPPPHHAPPDHGTTLREPAPRRPPSTPVLSGAGHRPGGLGVSLPARLTPRSAGHSDAPGRRASAAHAPRPASAWGLGLCPSRPSGCAAWHTPHGASPGGGGQPSALRGASTPHRSTVPRRGGLSILTIHPPRGGRAAWPGKGARRGCLPHPWCPTLALTCCRKRERRRSGRWRQSGAAHGSAQTLRVAAPPHTATCTPMTNWCPKTASAASNRASLEA